MTEQSGYGRVILESKKRPYWSTARCTQCVFLPMGTDSPPPPMMAWLFGTSALLKSFAN